MNDEVVVNETEGMHQLMAGTLEKVIEDIRQIQINARNKNDSTRPRWPMIVLKSPKGWTGPKIIDGLQVEGTFRAHQVPLSDPATHPEHLKLLKDWLRSYRPEELFDEQGRLKPELAELAPKGERRMGANPHTIDLIKTHAAEDRELARLLIREIDSLWVFLEVQGVDPTNNLAERSLRSGVLWRKRTHGTQSEKGNRWVERMLSLKQTCRMKCVPTFPVLVKAIDDDYKGRKTDLGWITK
ncbi:MAG: transposase [Deltaproteobacteria bacterium]|nr:transposase [Deltaproteobacteria bacterium]